MAEAMKTLKSGRTYIIPASAETAGHGTTAFARFWAAPLADFLRELPKGTN
jgi:homoserine O-acetyltransferase/O-succinyltransferase